MFGNDRVLELIRRNCRASAAELAEILLSAVTAFQNGTERFDDETVIVLRVR